MTGRQLSALGHVLGLIHEAQYRSHSIHAVISTKTNLLLVEEAWSRHAETQFGSSAARIPGPSNLGETSSIDLRVYSVWWEPSRWRLEYQLPDESGVVVHVVNGADWSHHDPRTGTQSSSGMVPTSRGTGIDLRLITMLNPVVLASWLRFRVVETCTYLDRSAMRIVAEPRAIEGDLTHATFAHIGWADSHVLVVDEERGLLLAITAYLGSEVVQHNEVLSIRYDDPVDSSYFDASFGDPDYPPSPPPPPHR